MTLKYFYVLNILLVLSSCGTTGHIALYNFDSSKNKVEEKIVTILISDSSFEIPQKWKEHMNGDYFKRLYIYFKEKPEEIYQFGFSGDSVSWSLNSTCKLGLISIYQGDQFKYEEDLSKQDKARIELRFEKEFLSKINFKYYKTE